MSRDPFFVYANLAAQRFFDYSWDRNGITDRTIREFVSE
jgi:hypothetical protein